MVNRSLISPTDIGEETIVVTFGNGASSKYPLAYVRVKIDEEEYCMKAAIVQELAGEVWHYCLSVLRPLGSLIGNNANS